MKIIGRCEIAADAMDCMKSPPPSPFFKAVCRQVPFPAVFANREFDQQQHIHIFALALAGSVRSNLSARFHPCDRFHEISGHFLPHLGGDGWW